MDLFSSHSPHDTILFAKQVGSSLKKGDILFLQGTLGAGKTLFARGVAEGLGITEPITSPTFPILTPYEGGRLPLYHFDLYRLDEYEEFFSLGGEEYLYGDGVTMVEWPEMLQERGIQPTKQFHIRVTEWGREIDSLYREP